MWFRKRLDLTISNLIRGMVDFFPNARRSQGYGYGEEALEVLCVRSGLDLLLDRLRLPNGSEALMSAVTIPDMALIVERHGLVPKPVDIDLDTMMPSVASLDAAWSPRSRILIVAHLFGNAQSLAAIGAFARKRGLILVEDCAQAFRGRDWLGNPEADVSLFSFGMIKTNTSLGGGLAIVRRNDELKASMRERLATYPVQGYKKHFARLLKCLLVVAATDRRVFGLICAALRIFAIEYDRRVQRFSRSFAAGRDLLEQVRARPSPPLVSFMRRRFAAFDAGKLNRRRAMGERAIELLDRGIQVPGAASPIRTHWVFPILADCPLSMVDALRSGGFDATSLCSLVAIADPARSAGVCPNAKTLLSRVVFLPMDPSMPDRELSRMIELVNREAAASG